MMKNKHLFVRLGFAFNGLKVAFSSEKSLRFQMIVAVSVFLILIALQPPLYWWAIVIIMIALVLAAELFNTALEIICDYVQPEYHEAIKNVKDISAAAVLIISLAAFIVGIFFLVDN